MFLAVFLELIGVISIILYQMGVMHNTYIEYVEQFNEVQKYSHTAVYEYVLKSYYNKTPDNEYFEEIIWIKWASCWLDEDWILDNQFDNNFNNSITDPEDWCRISLIKDTNANADPVFVGRLLWKTEHPKLKENLFSGSYFTIKKRPDDYEVNIFKRNKSKFEITWSFLIRKQ